MADLASSGSDDLEASWGDPAITLRCGVEPPGEYSDISDCTEAAGVGWYIPPEQIDDPGADVTLYAMSHRPVVEVEIPADYRPEGPATVMADLGPTLASSSLEEINPCR